MLSDDEAESILGQMVREDPLVWFEGCVKIVDKRNRFINPRANILQQRVAEYIVFCRKHGIPMRLIVLKPRQKGISTITVGVAQWLQKIMPRNMLIVGGLKWQADNLWRIYKTYAETDSFGWGFEGSVGEQMAEWGNGSTAAKQTAGGKAPGRSATIQILLCTEAAYWGHDTDVKNPDAALTALMASIPKGEAAQDTLVILESTSAGGAGMFYRRWQEAADLDAFLRGARSPDDFVRIFAGWYEFEDSYIAPRDKDEERAILAGEGARNEAEKRRERDLRVRYKLNAGQIKYWRAILAECGYDPDKRDREYPTTPEDAFRAAQPCRFNLAHLRILRDQALCSKLEFVMLDQPDKELDRYVPRPCDEKEANFILYERPSPGLRYLVAVDNASGRATGDDPHDTDCHAVVVIRDGYFDADRGTWKPPCVVATINPTANGAKGQRVDIDVLEEWSWRLAGFYGHCLIVPEANNDRGLIRNLRKRGARIYEQERPATQVESHKPSGKYGFWTRGGEYEKSRNIIIEDLARAVRELLVEGDGIEIPFTFILDEMEHFAIDPDTGKAEAMSGWHDDWVMALAIGFACRHGATAYHPPVLKGHALPRDLRIGTATRFEGKGADRI